MKAVEALVGAALLLGAGGCGAQSGPTLLTGQTAMSAPDESAQADVELANRIIADAAAQVRRCYRAPRVARAGRQIASRIEVRLNPDGTLAALPQLVSQSGVTPANRVYASPMAEAASLAIIRCAPLRLPPEHHGRIWSQFELEFSPRAAA
jgi:hypothetical protein